MSTTLSGPLVAAMLIGASGVIALSLVAGAEPRDLGSVGSPASVQDTLPMRLRMNVDSGTCIHRPTTKWNCPSGPTRLIPLNEIRSISFTVRKRDGRTFTQTFPPDSVDAVFFTPDAVEKFVFPYYARVFGPDSAAQMRLAYLRRPGLWR